MSVLSDENFSFATGKGSFATFASLGCFQRIGKIKRIPLNNNRQKFDIDGLSSGLYPHKPDPVQFISMIYSLTRKCTIRQAYPLLC